MGHVYDFLNVYLKKVMPFPDIDTLIGKLKCEQISSSLFLHFDSATNNQNDLEKERQEGRGLAVYLVLHTKDSLWVV